MESNKVQEQIKSEIQRFESVHPSIYTLYDLIECIDDPLVAQQIRHHVVAVEDSFVNSQEWTLSRSVPELRLGVLGLTSSGKSALVHRYLTGSYMHEESPEGGRFKKEVSVDGASHLMLIRDEGGAPDFQFSQWVDAVMFVFSLESEATFNAVFSYYAKLSHHRNISDLPLILVGTQDTISERNPRIVEESRARRLAQDLNKRCSYYETCATYGLNVDRVFLHACQKIIQARSTAAEAAYDSSIPPPGSCPSTPSHHHNNFQKFHFYIPPSANQPGLSPSRSLSSLNKDEESEEKPTPLSTPNAQRKTRRISNIFRKEEEKPNTRMQSNGLGSGRTIPLKQGLLYKRSSKTLNKEWKKKYVALYSDGNLIYYPSLKEFMDESHGKDIFLGRVTVKIPPSRPRSTANENDIDDHSPNGKLETPNLKQKKKHTRKGSGMKSPGDDSDNYEFHVVALDGRQWMFEACSYDERDEWVRSIQAQILSYLQGNPTRKTPTGDPHALRSLPGNQCCADCSASDPTWASLNLGMLICIDCSGIHRQLGSHISRVRSLELDQWPEAYLSLMHSFGNLIANAIWEFDSRGRRKPVADSTRENKEAWIRAKYQTKEFLSPLPSDQPIVQQLSESVSRGDIRSVFHILAYCSAPLVNQRVGGRAPLHISCALPSPEMSQLLIWAGADPGLPDDYGRAPKWYADAARSAACLQILKDAAAHR